MEALTSGNSDLPHVRVERKLSDGELQVLAEGHSKD